MNKRERPNRIATRGLRKIIVISTVSLTVAYFLLANISRIPLIGSYLTGNVDSYIRDGSVSATTTSSDPSRLSMLTSAGEQTSSLPPVFIPTHINRPERLKAIYISSWVAGTPSIFNRLLGLIERTEINAVVIDIKDDTGYISYRVKNPELSKEGTDSRRISDIEELIRELHDNDIYVIGRVSTFQDPLYTQRHPGLAVIRKSDGAVWRDRKGLSWLDPGSKITWDYVLSIAKESYSRGFDEINFDYIRFPSDGNMKDIAYRHYDETTMTRQEQMKLFYEYLHQQLSSPTSIPHSADLFGMTTTAEDDMGIGQIFSDALPYFDFIMPMVYPSHYGPGINGYAKPAEHPYEMVMYALAGALDKASTTDKWQGDSLPPSYKKVVPWLQDFSLSTHYDDKMVRVQIKAVEDSGLDSWVLWDPANKYTEGALERK